MRRSATAMGDDGKSRGVGGAIKADRGAPHLPRPAERGEGRGEGWSDGAGARFGSQTPLPNPLPAARGEGTGGWWCLRLVSFALCLLSITIARPAHAQIVAEPASPYPDPSLFARGLFVQAEAGTVIPLGPARQTLSAGPALGVRAGYELARWFAVQVHGLASTHAVDVASGPQAAQLIQITQVSAELKLSIPIGAWSLFAQGGAGRARLSTNLLGTTALTDPGVRVSLTYGGSGGIDYHTRSRHFSCGLAGGLTKLTEFATTGTLNVSTYLRYTF